MATTTEEPRREVGAFEFIPKPVDFNQLKPQHANCPTHR
jgi:hypothetical protein